MTLSVKTTAETELEKQFAALDNKGAFSAPSGTAGKFAFLPEKAERQKALAMIESQGLPAKNNENWHYTDLRRHLGHIAAFKDNDIQEESNACLPPLLKDSHIFALINGQAIQQQNEIMPGIHAHSLANTSFTTGNADMKDTFFVLPTESADGNSDIIGAINTAFVRDGWHIAAAPQDNENQSPKIIELQNIQHGGQAHSRIPVSIEKNAKMIFIERQIGNDEDSFLSFISQLHLAENAEVHWIILRERGIASAELNRFQAVLHENAKLTLYVINAGCSLLRQEINVDLVGKGADFQLRGINLLSGNSHNDTTMIVRHLVENTSSAAIFRNVVTEEARGVFQGMIRVAKIAQKTDARMACNSLILSDKAEFNAKPELEIFADDVACGHGATVAEIDKQHLFYLMARGIPQGEARAMLVKAFIDSLIDELPQPLAEVLHRVPQVWLEKHLHKI